MARKRKKIKDDRSFSEKWSERARDAKHLSSTLASNPKEFPGAAQGVLRRFLRRLWGIHGGGLYSLGFIAVFLWLEIRMLAEDIVAFDGFSFFAEQFIQFVFRFTFESFINTLKALLWPLYFVQYDPPWGIVMLAAAFAIFPRTLERPIERWLFGEEIPNRPIADSLQEKQPNPEDDSQ